MFEAEKKQVLQSALQMKEYRLISLTGGNVSLRVEGGNFLVTPSGMAYETMSPEDIVVVDASGKVVEGRLKPSSDTPALLYIFEKMPWVNAIIHTHQPYATAVGLSCDLLPACMVTIIDANRADVQVAPFTASSDVGMGELTVEYAGDALAVILKHHGVMAYGASMEEALYSAVYLEEAAKTYIMARVMGPVPLLTPEQIAQEAAGWETYGQ